MDCIFCKIASGKISARIVYETKYSLAFLDANPLTQGHSLVIPKTHYTKIQEMSVSDTTDLFEAVRILAGKMELLLPSLLIAIHNGKESGQEIPHLHVHLIPRSPSDGAGPVHSMFPKRPSLSDNEFENIARIIRDKK